MEREFPTLPFVLHRMLAVAEEERRLNARCVATGLPPFPPSVVGLHLFYVAPEPFHHPAQPLLLSPEQLGLGFEAIPRHTEFPKLKTPKLEFEENPEIHAEDNNIGTVESMPLPSLSPAGLHRPESMETRGRVDDENAEKELSLSLSPARAGESPEMILRLFPDPPRIQRQRSRTSAMARTRRMKVSERMGKLAELMPWERRVDTSTLLEEARRYVVFLQAQVAALTWMPVEGTVDRQEALRAVASSRRMQEWMYKRELCIWSAEQMLHMRRAAQLSPPPPPPPPSLLVQEMQQH